MIDANGWERDDYVALIECAAKGGFMPEHWLQFATCESSLKPTAKNPYADARGLWQAMGATLKNLGWVAGNPDFDAAGGDFCKASIPVQIRWSARYLEGWRARFKLAWSRAGDMYLCNFTPAYLPHKDEPFFTLYSYSKDPQTYWVNRGQDRPQDGFVVQTIVPPARYAKDPPYKGKGQINVKDMEIATSAALLSSTFKTAVQSMNKLLQEGLNRRGEALVVDGVLGPKSLAALAKFAPGAALDAKTRLSLL